MNDSLSRLLGSRHKEDTHEHFCQILARIPIFEGLSRRELAAVERIMHRREYARDEVIFRQDEPGLGMYIIDSGTVGILAEPSGLELSEMGAGEFFGEVALLDESPRSATAVARTECVIFGFFQPDLFGLIDRDPRLGVKIVLRLARILGERLRKANEQIHTAHETIAGRLTRRDQ